MTKIKINDIDVTSAEKEGHDSALILTRANAIIIRNQSDYEQVIQFEKMAKERYKEIDIERKKITMPIDEAKKNVMNLFRPALENYESAYKKARVLLLQYENEQERKRREAEAKLQAEAEKKRIEAMRKAEEARAAGKENIAEKYEAKAENVPVPVVAPTFERPKGFVSRTLWKYEILDESLIPRAYLMPSDEKLRKQATATHDSIPIPGIRFYCVEV